MGGTFTRSSFAAQAKIQDNEVLGAISPVGRPHKKRSLADTLIRTLAGSQNRKPWSELFFDDTTATPLSIEKAGTLNVPFECVRIAPSASNKQPWRLIRQKNAIHFFLKRTKGYGKAFKGIDLQAMDMGIAMCHFETAVNECGLSGTWRNLDPALNKETLEYVTSFVIAG